MKKSSIKIISLLVILTMALSSCLKDLEDYIDAFGSSPAVAELSEAPNAASGMTFVYVTFAPGEADAALVRVNIASVNPMSTDTKITLAIDDAMVTEYNHMKGYDTLPPIPDKLFYAVPAAAINVTSYDVTIPAGEREADWNIKINPNLIPDFFNVKYMIGVKIVSATNGLVVSGNYGRKFVNVLAKNKYHGSYNSIGFFDHPTAFRAINMDKNLLSTGATTVTAPYADLGGSGYQYSSMSIDEVTPIVVAGRTETCYKVTFTFLPASATWYTYDLAKRNFVNATPPIVDPVDVVWNYCYKNAGGKWVFVLFTGYNGTRFAWETMTQY